MLGFFAAGLMAGAPVTAPSSELDAERARLEAEIQAEMAKAPQAGPPSAPMASAGAPGSAQVKLLDLSFDLLAVAGGSTAEDELIDALQRGDHDPKRRGVTIQNFEITGTGAVDPYFNGEAHLVLKIDREGETAIELEEVFLTTTSLPLGLQIKAGQVFEAFGRQNPQHPHAFQFVDHTLVNSRFLGPDGLRSQGVELSWLAPTPWFLLVTGGVYNANGETEYSFVNTEEPPYYTNVDPNEVDSVGDLQILARLAQSFDLGDTTSTTLGGSWVRGPNSTGDGAHTDIFGADAYLRWKPVVNEQGWPFVQLQAEWMSRRYEQASGADASGARYPHDVIRDWGYYAQLVWGFQTRWTAGVRWDQVGGDSAASASDALLAARRRVSPAVTFYASEFSKLRLQYNLDYVAAAGPGSARDEHSVWLALEFLLGKHGAHRF